ncbi:tyrosine-type recombinase/integrase [Nitriliruptor alkaliphilus]|uniref:tyrosine-type recombinase/integrase n=1 Tax=Nitriliruptor alkaliphilus TaxID=427918 RepID=UPI0006967F28|nr:tyrosine-type recombinase/integrase [Nitriliruptor alkaliphilus]
MSVSEGKRGRYAGVSSYTLADGSKRWRVRYELERDGAGNRQRKTQRGFTSEAEARRFLRETQDAIERRTYVSPDKVTVADYLVDEWLPSIRPRGGATARRHRGSVGLSTWETYGHLVRAHLVPSLGAIPLQALTPAHVDRLYDVLERDKGLSPKSVVNVHGVLHKALSAAVKAGRTSRNVASAVDAPQAGRSQSAWWSPAELRRFVRHVEGDRLYAMWLLFVTTGMRRGEVAGLTWEDVDLDEGRLRVTWTLGIVDSQPTWKRHPKSKAGERTMALDPATVDALRAWKVRQAAERLAMGPGWRDGEPDHLGTSRTGVVFTRTDGWVNHPERVSTWFHAHRKAAELPRIRLHDVRHSYASAALASAAGWHEVKVISERLGHANVAITLDTYSHVLPAADEVTAHTLARLILEG